MTIPTNKVLETYRWFQAVFEDDGSYDGEFEECEPICYKSLDEWTQEEPGKFYWECKDGTWGQAYDLDLHLATLCGGE